MSRRSPSLSHFLLRRLGHAVFMLFGVSLLTFFLIRLAPGDPFAALRLNPQVSPATIAGLRRAYGLNLPLPLQYWHWLRAVLHGEFGYSMAFNSPVWPLFKSRAAHTLLLALSALLLSWLLAIPLGVWAAARRGGWVDRLAGGGTSLLQALPDVLLALLLLGFALWTGWLPLGGMHSLGYRQLGPAARLLDLLRHMLLPLLALVAVALPLLVRHVRAAMLDVLAAPYIAAARGLGVPRRRLLFRHALPAAANPLLSLFGLSIGALLSGSLMVEVVMSWPGLGPLLLEAILNRDRYIVAAAVLASAVFIVGGSLLADLLLYWADPRIRVE